MKLYLADITDSIKSESADITFVGESFNGGSKMISDSYTVTYYRAQTTVVIDVAADFEFSVDCARCLEPLAVSMNVKEQFVLFPKSSGDNDYYYSGEYIEVEPFIREAVVVNIPDRIFCSEDCKGLCPVCGKNLNLHKCSCNIE